MALSAAAASCDPMARQRLHFLLALANLLVPLSAVASLRERIIEQQALAGDDSKDQLAVLGVTLYPEAGQTWESIWPGPGEINSHWWRRFEASPPALNISQVRSTTRLPAEGSRRAPRIVRAAGVRCWLPRQAVRSSQGHAIRYIGRGLPPPARNEPARKPQALYARPAQHTTCDMQYAP